MTVTVNIDTSHGLTGFTGRPDAQNTPMAGTPEHLTEQLARGLDIGAPHVRHIDKIKMFRPNGKARRVSGKFFP